MATTKFSIASKLKMNSGPANVAERVTAYAIRTGYRHVDSATVYHNEQPAAAGMLANKSIPREQLFFTSKISPRDMSYDAAARSVDESLQKTGLSYIDLYLLHAPYGGREGRLGAWQALVHAVAKGKIRSIGVSNYGVQHLQELEAWMKQTDEKEGKGAGGVLSVNQVELHPWLARPDIAKWCKERGVVLQAYCPVVRGQRFHEPKIETLAKKHSKTPAQVLLRWSLQMGFNPLPKSVTESRIEENANIFDFALSDEDMKTLDTGDYAPCAWDPTTMA